VKRIAAACALVCSCSFPEVTFAPDDASLDGAQEAAADAGGDETDPCDKDRDGFKAIGACGGNDCNDDDPRVHPGADFRTDVPDAGPLLGDWNCDGNVEQEWNAITCGATSCNAQGFDAPTSCGMVGNFVVCSGVLCPAADAGTRAQGCR